MPVVYFAFRRQKTTVISSSPEGLPVKDESAASQLRECALMSRKRPQAKFRGNRASWDTDWYNARVQVPEESAFVSSLGCKWNRSDDLNLMPCLLTISPFQKFTVPTVRNKPAVLSPEVVVLIRNAPTELQEGRKISQHLRLGTMMIANLSVSAVLKYSKSNLA